MLLNDLYIIQSLSESENLLDVMVELKPDHAIFKGHFPDQPVLPGVCMMEMIREIAGYYFRQSFRITGAPLVKFLHMINPQKNLLIHFEIKYESNPPKTLVNGKIFFETEIFMKFQIDLSGD